MDQSPVYLHKRSGMQLHCTPFITGGNQLSKQQLCMEDFLCQTGDCILTWHLCSTLSCADWKAKHVNTCTIHLHVVEWRWKSPLLAWMKTDLLLAQHTEHKVTHNKKYNSKTTTTGNETKWKGKLSTIFKIQQLNLLNFTEENYNQAWVESHL